MFHGSRPQTMGRAWPQTTPYGKQPRRFQAKTPERSMVAARKPWDAPGLKQHQMGNKPEGFKPKNQNVPW